MTTQSNKFLVVEIPGKNRQDLLETVQRQAQLRFRLVACSDSDPSLCAQAPHPTRAPIRHRPRHRPQRRAVGRTHPRPSWHRGHRAARARPTPRATRRLPTTRSRRRARTGRRSASPTSRDAATDHDSVERPDAHAGPRARPTRRPLRRRARPRCRARRAMPPSRRRSPTSRHPPGPEVQRFNELTCAADGTLTDAQGKPVPIVDDPNKPLVTCSAPEPASGDNPATPATKYLLSPAVIEGTELDWRQRRAAAERVHLGGQSRHRRARARTTSPRSPRRSCAPAAGPSASCSPSSWTARSSPLRTWRA